MQEKGSILGGWGGKISAATWEGTVPEMLRISALTLKEVGEPGKI
jgi:hypothetical protein